MLSLILTWQVSSRWLENDCLAVDLLTTVPRLPSFCVQARWENRCAAASHCGVCITVDGTDFRIKEPSPFSPSWYSHKCNGPALRYEVGVCISAGWIVWFNGPFKAGEHSDLKTAKECGLRQMLDNGERHVADGACKTNDAVQPDDIGNHCESVCMKWCRSRHETVNGLFKRFKVATNRFERSPCKHGSFLHAIAQIAQLGLMTREMEPSFDVHDLQQPPSWPGAWESNHADWSTMGHRLEVERPPLMPFTSTVDINSFENIDLTMGIKH